jgi:hypothetical protein
MGGSGFNPMGGNQYMMPPMGGQGMGMSGHSRPDAEDESPMKRQRTMDEDGGSNVAESRLMPEDEWLMNHPVSNTLRILLTGSN